MAASSPAHKPRRKANKGDIDKLRAPAFPLAAFLWPARTSLSQWEVLPLVLMVVGLFRWAAGLWGYSGKRIGSYRGRWHRGLTAA